MASRNLAIRTKLSFCIVYRSIQLNLRISPLVELILISTLAFRTIGITAPCIAFSRGARILEKHFTLDHTAYGPDHQGSNNMDVGQLKEIVEFRDALRKTL